MFQAPTGAEAPSPQETKMDHTRWERIQELFHGAADLPETDHKKFLRAHCGDDDEW